MVLQWGPGRKDGQPGASVLPKEGFECHSSQVRQRSAMNWETFQHDWNNVSCNNKSELQKPTKGSKFLTIKAAHKREEVIIWGNPFSFFLRLKDTHAKDRICSLESKVFLFSPDPFFQMCLVNRKQKVSSKSCLPLKSARKLLKVWLHMNHGRYRVCGLKCLLSATNVLLHLYVNMVPLSLFFLGPFQNMNFLIRLSRKEVSEQKIIHTKIKCYLLIYLFSRQKTKIKPDNHERALYWGHENWLT